MSELSPRPSLKLDPWATSSLLQKAIRRGEVELAQYAAELFHRYRGKAIWRRLMLIAAEDIGIADISLLHEVIRLGSDKAIRSMLGLEAELMAQLVSRMAAATKDRSCDYLYCSATRLPAAKLESVALEATSFTKLIEIAADENVPLIRRAIAALLACAREGFHPKSKARRVECLLDTMSVRHLDLEEVVLRLGAAGLHEFAIMLPLIWSRWWHSRGGCTVVEDVLPTPEFVGGIPLYTFDKHTAAGKQAITNFAQQNNEVRNILAARIPMERRREAALMAAFYADATPVARRLQWAAGGLLAHSGFIADMAHASCEFEHAKPILDCVRANVSDLNQYKRAVLGRQASPAVGRAEKL